MKTINLIIPFLLLVIGCTDNNKSIQENKSQFVLDGKYLEKNSNVEDEWNHFENDEGDTLRYLCINDSTNDKSNTWFELVMLDEANESQVLRRIYITTNKINGEVENIKIVEGDMISYPDDKHSEAHKRFQENKTYTVNLNNCRINSFNKNLSH